MLTLSTKIQNRVIKKNVLTLATCIKIKLKNGNTIGFTTHTSNIRFIEEPNVIYYSKGFTPTALSQNNQMAVDNSDAKMIIDNKIIVDSDLETGVYNNAYYELFDIDWTLKTNGYFSYADIIPGINGVIGDIKRDINQFNCEFRSLAQYLQTTIIDVYKASCSATLGDPIKCQVDLNAVDSGGIPKWYDTDTVSAVIKNSQFMVTNSIRATGFFNNGTVEFLSGANVGKKYQIKTWDLATKTLTLRFPASYPVSPTDQIKITVGCGKNKPDCKTKFNNYVNYQGFINIPGMDFIVSGGGTKVNY